MTAVAGSLGKEVLQGKNLPPLLQFRAVGEVEHRVEWIAAVHDVAAEHGRARPP